LVTVSHAGWAKKVRPYRSVGAYFLAHLIRMAYTLLRIDLQLYCLTF